MNNSGIAAKTSIPRGFAGFVRGATLADLVQLECLGMTTRAMRIDCGQQSGQIFFSRGQVVHAEIAGLRGDAALTELMGWPGGRFSIREGVQPAEVTIERPWQSLLIEAAYRQDEMRSNLPGAEAQMGDSTVSVESKSDETALGDAFDNAEDQSAGYPGNDRPPSDASEELHAASSGIMQLARLVYQGIVGF